MISATGDKGLESRFSVGVRNHEEMIVSHLLFANDTLIFCEPNCEHLYNLQCPFLCFDAVLGLKINLSKSEIVPIDDVGDVEGLASILGCRVAYLPMKYLGHPLGAPYKASTIWNGIIEKKDIVWRVERGSIYQREAG
jgi:hypothetical protein